MADETTGEKTEAPTPRRRAEAREQGNIARSPDLSAAVLLIGILYLLRSFGGSIVSSLKTVVAQLLSEKSLSDFNPLSAGVEAVRAAGEIGIALAPLFFGIVLIAITVNLAQVGLNFNTTRITPNFAALNPIRGLDKLWGGSRGVMRLAMGLIKVVMVGLTAYSAVHARIVQIVTVQRLEFIQIFGLGAQIIFDIALRVGALLLVLALLDYAWQRYQFEQELKMSKQDVKEEMRRMDGDPKIKQRRRQIAIQRHIQRLKKEIPKADVVITNPTHFAVALQYEPDKMRAPRVIAKGQDLMALRIREIAIEHNIPLVERAPLARALYKMCDVGDEIPEDLYSAVAEILAYVYQLAKKTLKAA